MDPNVNAVAAQQRLIPYHLKDRAQRTIQEMIQQDIVEEHPQDQPVPWVSNVVLTPKPDNGIRVTLDA